METFTFGWGRWRWVIRALGRHPLVRLSDRVEAAFLVLVVAAVLVAVAVAGAVGTAVYSARAQVYTEEARIRHTVSATAIEDSTFIGKRYEPAFSVQTRWLAGGVEHFGSLELPQAAKAGDQLDVWVDGRGNRSRRRLPPRTPEPMRCLRESGHSSPRRSL